jgi:hypothetical protein
MHFAKEKRAQGSFTFNSKENIMLKEQLSETFKQLNRNLDEISFEEILQEAEAFIEAERNAVTLKDNVIPKLVALKELHPNSLLGLFFNIDPRQYAFITITRSATEMIQFLDKHPIYKNPSYTVAAIEPSSIFIEDNLN